MPDYLKSLSADQIERIIKNGIDDYLGTDFDYTVKDLNTPYADTEGNRITFEVEIKDDSED